MRTLELPTQEDWRLLGIDPKTRYADAHRAYLRLAQRHHPDRGGSAASFLKVESAWRRVGAALEYRDAHGLASAVSIEDEEAGESDEALDPDVEGYSSPSRNAESYVTVPLFERVVRKIGRAIFLAGRFPEREWSSVFVLVSGCFLGLLVHCGVHPAVLSNLLDGLIGIVVVGRIVATPTRLNR